MAYEKQYIHVLTESYREHTSVVTPMLPEISMQKITRESLPIAASAPVLGEGISKYKVGSSFGVSSGTIPVSSLQLPQNSHTQT